MSEQPVQRSLWWPFAMSMSLLLAGVGAMLVRFELIQRFWERENYRREVLSYAKAQARVAAGTIDLRSLPGKPHLEPVTVRSALSLAVAIAPTLTILTVGLLALVLIAGGRRILWLPLAGAALFLNEGIALTYGYGTWQPGFGRSVSLLVIAVAAAPLLLATRSRPVVRPRVPRPVALVATIAVAVPAVIAFAGPNNSNVPEPLAALAGVSYGVLVAASSLPRRWLPGLLFLPVLALPGVGWALSDGFAGSPVSDFGAVAMALGLLAYVAVLLAVPLPRRFVPIAVLIPVLGLPQSRDALVDGLNGYSPVLPSFVGPMALVIGLTAFGAAVVLYGPRLLALWRRATHHGPTLHRAPRTGVPA